MDSGDSRLQSLIRTFRYPMPLSLFRENGDPRGHPAASVDFLFDLSPMVWYDRDNRLSGGDIFWAGGLGEWLRAVIYTHWSTWTDGECDQPMWKASGIELLPKWGIAPVALWRFLCSYSFFGYG